MRIALGITLGCLFALIVACSTSSTGAPVGGVDCSNPPRCANDPAPSQNAVDECQKLASDPCAAKYSAQNTCITNNIKCTSAGKSDNAATNAACQTQIADEQACEDSLMDAGLEAGSPTDAGGGG